MKRLSDPTRPIPLEAVITLPKPKEFWLEHPDRLRTVVFLVEGETVRLRKKVGQTWVAEEELSLEFARKKYAWYIGLDYCPW